MYKMCIILGWPVIKMQLLSPYKYEHFDIWAKIKQHKFLTSPGLNAYYLGKAEEEGLQDEYMGFMQHMLEYEYNTEIKDTISDLSKNIVWYLKNRNKVIAVAIGIENDFELTKSSCQYQYTIEQAAEDENGPFAMYSVKAHFFKKQNESAKDCLEWIKNQIQNENEINIIDPYILEDDRNYHCLIDYYFPAIRAGSIVNIHTVENPRYKEQATYEAEKHNINLKFYYYRDMHNRYITTSDRIISLPLGVDFMKTDRSGCVRIRKSTDFTLLEKKANGPYLEVEKGLAGICV